MDFLHHVKSDHQLLFRVPLWRVLLCLPAGLQSEHLPEAAVERPPPGLQRVSRRLAGSGPVHVGLHLETGSVLRQRKGRQLPRGHHGQQAAAHLQKRQCAVQHTVRGGATAHHHICTFVLLYSLDGSACKLGLKKVGGRQQIWLKVALFMWLEACLYQRRVFIFMTSCLFELF